VRRDCRRRKRKGPSSLEVAPEGGRGKKLIMSPAKRKLFDSGKTGGRFPVWQTGGRPPPSSGGEKGRKKESVSTFRPRKGELFACFPSKSFPTTSLKGPDPRGWKKKKKEGAEPNRYLGHVKRNALLGISTRRGRLCLHIKKRRKKEKKREMILLPARQKKKIVLVDLTKEGLPFERK